MSLVPIQAAPAINTLAQIRCSGSLDPAAPWVTLPLTLVDTPPMDELWTVDDVVEKTDHGPIHTRRSQHHSFSWLWIKLSEHDGMAAASEWAYRLLLEHLQQSSHPHLLKIWHYLPAINQGDDDCENYRRFCRGREQALRQSERSAGPLPAATAIGIPQADARYALFYWLSCAAPGINIENPRQTHAWRYPRRYGPSSPNFSRGTLSEFSRQFFISGTASVVGHDTAHPHDSSAQTREMLNNLQTLLDTARQRCAQLPDLSHLDGPLRLYLRHPHEWPQLRQICVANGLPLERLIVCHGDICRDDLTIELDGIQTLRSA